jgi:two-component system, chemotaxis family, protein-glutamate methylesterase/glutaminase
MPIRVLVVDDTLTYRSIMSKVVQAMPELQLVDTANNGQIALDKMAKTPVDLVLLDVEMPVMDGITTLQHIRQKHPKTHVVFVSAVNRSAADMTIRALQMGALDFITKPDAGNLNDNYTELHKRVQQVIAALHANGSSATVTTRAASSTLATRQPVKPKRASIKLIEALVIGVSTGGPNALAEVIPRLKNAINVPVFLVQHMPPLFTQSLATNLDRKSDLTVKEASDGEPVQSGFVYIAPGGHHMGVSRKDGHSTIHIMDTPPENSCRPSVDTLFRSVCQAYGGNVLAVIMTGMGNDGQKGVELLKKQGAYCLTQSKDSCVVYGMPRAVDEAGLSDERIPLAQLADRINTLICGGTHAHGGAQ